MPHIQKFLANTPAAAIDLTTLLDRCAELTNELAHLPAVPTIDWCDRSAHVFGSVVLNRGAGCAILDLHPSGHVKSVLATDAAPGELTTNEISQHRINSIRFALETLSHVPLLPGFDHALARDSKASIETPMSGHLCMGTPANDVFLSKWGIEGSVDMLWSLSPLSGRVRGRTLVGYVAAQTDVQSVESARLLLQSCVNLAARLASNALSCTDNEGHVAWLTPREQDVLERLVEGKSVREISDELERSQHTVHDYVKSLHRKLGATSRGELVAKALGHVHANGSN